MFKHDIWRIWKRRKENQMVPNRTSTKTFPRREKISGKD
jgi:hypothetical protein